MSARSAVPAAVPSLRQSSRPWAPSSAANTTVIPVPLEPGGTAKPSGLEPPAPELMSDTRAVPAVVPSLRQSSRPWAPSSAEKYANVCGTESARSVLTP
jgi:hypothetical protein